jgi:transposase
MAGKACSSKANRACLRGCGITAVILERKDQEAHCAKRGSRGGRPPKFDPERYKERNTVERCFSKLRQHRAVAARYDNSPHIFRGTIDVTSIRIWLRDPSHGPRN